VDDPAVADVKASLRDRDDIAKRGHPVLQRSPISSNSSRECFSGRRLPVCPHVLRDQQGAAGADTASIRHNLPRQPCPAAPINLRQFQRRPEAALPRRRLGERHVADGKRLEPSPKVALSTATGSASRRTVLTEESSQTGNPASPRSQ
jgi:hypothetical protein